MAKKQASSVDTPKKSATTVLSKDLHRVASTLVPVATTLSLSGPVGRLDCDYRSVREAFAVPNLVEIQKQSFDLFLQRDVPPSQRSNSGLQAVFLSAFPVRDPAGRFELDFIEYSVEDPKFNVEDCRRRSVTYSAPLKAKLALTLWESTDLGNGRTAREFKVRKEQEIFIGDVPLMTDTGTFIVNGVERVIVSQMHRSPGIFFDHDRGRNTTGRPLFNARIIPYRGTWLDFGFDTKDILYVRVDRRRKFPVTTLLMALPSLRHEETKSKDKKKGSAAGQAHEIMQGMSREEILKEFYAYTVMHRQGDSWRYTLRAEGLVGRRLMRDLVDARSGEVLLKVGEKVTRKFVEKLQAAKVSDVVTPSEELYGHFLASDLVDVRTGEIFAEAGDALTKELFDKIDRWGVKSFECLDIDNIHVGPYIRNTLHVDRSVDRDTALVEIFRMVRPSEVPTIENCDTLIHDMIHDPERYDLSAVGRVKMNARLGFSDDDVSPDSHRVLRKADIIAMLKVLVSLRDGRGEPDDIDHLGNRRVRSVGELLENQCRTALIRLERSVRERFAALDFDSVMPNDLINSKPIGAALREFLNASQLSQFMDQTNPLSEVTHKRRLSALGPGGLLRERAGFEVRDVHPTHYGRICPVETPEGPNIGLINSLAIYARVNRYGFIEAPYRKVVNGMVSEDIQHLAAFDEERYSIAQANSAVDEHGRLLGPLVLCRRAGDFITLPPEEVDYVDVAPNQLVSVAAALIPFLENDDANRVLMGANMQRQAVPLLVPKSPLVRTGMESRVARDSGALILTEQNGIVDSVDSGRIVVRSLDADDLETGIQVYKLKKFQRSNHSTCVNQKPIVKVGMRVNRGDVIADGPACDLGELALGRNILVAFMPWNGYNFEDSIVVSERLVQDDVFTSIHIEELEAVVRDTKLGEESITRDIPNVSEEALVHLDESGIAYIGARVEADDILVGKVTPKGETPATPEEKLLRLIFGEKVSYVRDSSLRLPPGNRSTVIDVRIFNRRGVDADERLLSIERDEIRRMTEDRDSEKEIYTRSYRNRLEKLVVGQVSAVDLPKIAKGSTIKAEAFAALDRRFLRDIVVQSSQVAKMVNSLHQLYEEQIRRTDADFKTQVEKLQTGSDLPPGVMKVVKVFVAVKRKLQIGDKMAGRHGNKGVVSAVVPAEDMPFLADGRHVDMVLNPLGVPSRMNIGQILETHLGWACAGMGEKIGKALMEARKEGAKHLRAKLRGEFIDDPRASKYIDALDDDRVIELAKNLQDGVPVTTPVFDGIREKTISNLLERCGLHRSGQVNLIDGRTGEPFENPATVGYIYMLKLHHLVDDKMHARSIGPYSLVTQQPLGGKAHFGGQRLGEMEVWALQAYGAAYTLQELLTVKSDDVSGRAKIYEAIVRGGADFESGLPESFNVLIKELRSLCLNVDLLKESALQDLLSVRNEAEGSDGEDIVIDVVPNGANARVPKVFPSIAEDSSDEDKE